MASEQKERAVRPITVVKFAGAVIATLIGSGFASGQEAMQFFAAYGTNAVSYTHLTLPTTSRV